METNILKKILHKKCSVYTVLMYKHPGNSSLFIMEWKALIIRCVVCVFLDFLFSYLKRSVIAGGILINVQSKNGAYVLR